jgi:hypothetical protein
MLIIFSAQSSLGADFRMIRVPDQINILVCNLINCHSDYYGPTPMPTEVRCAREESNSHIP